MCQSNSTRPACGVVFVRREGTWDRAGTPGDIPSTADEVDTVRKNRLQLFAQISACSYLGTRWSVF